MLLNIDCKQLAQIFSRISKFEAHLFTCWEDFSLFTIIIIFFILYFSLNLVLTWIWKEKIGTLKVRIPKNAWKKEPYLSCLMTHLLIFTNFAAYSFFYLDYMWKKYVGKKKIGIRWFSWLSVTHGIRGMSNKREGKGITRCIF